MQLLKDVRVFISSTFRDMHAERDHLVRFVFPELKEKCRRHRVHLTDVDLRWGVTESDAQEGRALEICLDEIDSCRPYFLGLLGHRYGWIPPGEQHSITAREIHHGVLHHDLPAQVVDLRRITQGKLENRSLSRGQIDCLERCYVRSADRGKYTLRRDATADELETIRSVFEQYSAYQRDRSFFFFRSETLTRELAGSNVADFFELDERNQEKLRSLKQDIRDAGLPVCEYHDIEDFGRRVSEVLWEHIEAELDQPIRPAKDWLDEEAEIHELFMEDRTRYFAGRRQQLEHLHALCERDGGPSVIVVSGESGCGKSALVSRFGQEASRKHPDWLIIPHFVGASPSSTNLRLTLRRLCSHLNRLISPPRDVPQDVKDLAKAFPDFLEKAARKRRILVILDGLNQLDKADGAHAMRWLPGDLPRNSRFLFSTLPGEALHALLSRQVKPAREELTGLSEPEIRELVQDYLQEIRRAFPNQRVAQVFFEKVKGGNPLYILVALEELRIFGRFEDLPERIESLPADVPALFDQVLERIEGDFNPELVRDCMSLIACGRQGMTAEELQALLGAHAPVSAPQHLPGKLPDMLWARLYRAFSAYLFERSGVITVFHGQLAEAVARRYLKEDTDRRATHQRIGSYFEERWREPYLRALEELPYQRTKAGDWEGLERVLSDFDFLRAKVEAVGPHPLIDDHALALEAGCQGEGLPLALQALQLSAHVLAEDPYQFAGQLIGRLLSSHPSSFKPALDQAARWKGRSWLRPLSSRLIAPGAALERTLTGHSGSVLALALMPGGNAAVSGGADGTLRVWDLERWEMLDTLTLPSGRGDKLTAGSRPGELGDLAGLESPTGLRSDVSAPGVIAVTPDGRCAVFSVLRDPAIWVWDLQKNALAATLKGHSNLVYSVAVTPDGKYALSGGADGLLLLWKLEQTGGKELEPVHFFTNHNDAVTTVDVTGDGACAVSGSWDKTIRVWDIEKRKLLRTIHAGRPVFKLAIMPDSRRVVSISKGATVQVWALDRPVSWLQGIARRGAVETLPGDVFNLAVTPDGKRAVVATLHRALAVWDLERAACVATLADVLPDRITGIVVTPDGRRALTSSNNGTIGVWNLSARRAATSAADHRDAVRTAAITPDGRLAVTGSIDRSIKVWDLKTQRAVHTLSGHEDAVLTVAVTANGKLAVSGSMDNTIRVWDLERGSELRCLKGHVARVNSVAVTDNGKHAVSGAADTTVRTWDLRKGELLDTHTVHQDNVTSLAMTADGKRMLTSSMDHTIRVWDIRLDTLGGDDLAELIKVTLSGLSTPSGRILHEASGVNLAAAITRDGGLAVTGSAEGELKVWDLERMCEIRTLDGPPKAVWSLSMTPEGRPLLAATEGRNVNIWDMRKWQRVTTFTADSEFLCCAVARDGETLVAGDAGGNVHVFRLEGRE